MRLRILIQRALFCVTAGSSMIGGGQVFAQPGNPGPASFIDLGDLDIGQTLQSGDFPISSGVGVWFRFRLTTSITPHESWLDVDTAGPSTIPNNEVALYDAWGNRIGQDNDNGGGTTGWAAAMSFGGGSGEKLSGEAPGWGGGRISDGWWGANLEAGVYYVIISGYDATFPDPNPNWGHTTSSTASGTVRLRLSTGLVPPTYWNERHRGTDGGALPSTAQVIAGTGPLETIVAAFGGGARDMFKIRICGPMSFQVRATPTFGEPCCGGGVYRARLFLFDEAGRGVAAINNTIAGTDTTLILPQPVAPGNYYLAITSYCAAYFAGTPGDGGPLDSQNQAVWDFSGNHNLSIVPNGAGAANPIAYWGRQQMCAPVDVADEAYYTRLSLTGACHVESTGCCAGDMNFDELLDGADIQLFVDNLLNGQACP